MNLSLGLIQQGLIIALCVVAVIAISSRLFLPFLQKKLSSYPVRFQAKIILLICSLPLLTVIFALTISFLPSFINILGLGPDHCDLHTGGHSHLCATHPSLPITHWLTWFSSIFALSFLAISTSICRDYYQTWRLMRYVNNTDKRLLSAGTWLIDSEVPFAFVVGLISPKVMLSTALKNKLTPEQLDIVLAHENDHKIHHDVLRLSVARALSLLHFPEVRKRLLAQLSLATEKACDEAASIKSNNRITVAETLVVIERLCRENFNSSSSVALGVVDNTVVERVHSLLNDTNTLKSHPNWLIAFSAAFMFCAALSYNEIHLFVETLLGYIIH